VQKIKQNVIVSQTCLKSSTGDTWPLLEVIYQLQRNHSL